MVTRCAWCWKILRITTDHSDLVSHGICEKCAARVEREYQEARWAPDREQIMFDREKEAER